MVSINRRPGSTFNPLSRVISPVVMVCIGLIFYLSTWVPPAIGAPQGKPDKVTLIVKTAKGLTAAQGQSAVRGHGGTPKGSVPKLNLQIIEVPAYAAEAIMNNLRGDAAVLRVEENRTRRFQSTPSDTYFGQQWGLSK